MECHPAESTKVCFSFFSPTQIQGGQGFYFKIKISIKSSCSHLHTYILNALFKETKMLFEGQISSYPPGFLHDLWANAM